MRECVREVKVSKVGANERAWYLLWQLSLVDKQCMLSTTGSSMGAVYAAPGQLYQGRELGKRAKNSMIFVAWLREGGGARRSDMKIRGKR